MNPDFSNKLRTIDISHRHSVQPQARLRSKRVIDKDFVEEIKIFSENTSAHGVRRIFVANNSCSARLWLSGIALCFVILMIQTYHLFVKFNNYEKITNIEIKFDQMEFPAVTFCNINPYKKSLMKFVPAVKDTMDVFENARADNKEIERRKSAKATRRREKLDEEEMIRKLFENSDENDIMLDTDRADIVYGSSENGVYRQTQKSNWKRYKRVANKTEYTIVESHCTCIGPKSIECIQFKSAPVTQYARCYCAYNRRSKIVWPCFNFTLWYETKCLRCFESGFCDLGSRKTGNEIASNDSCMCSNKTSPVCIKTGDEQEIQKVWYLFAPTSTTTTTTAPTTARNKNQSARVTAPETIKAMGFAGITDSVAMMIRAKENLMFTMSSFSIKQRTALSQQKYEMIEMCSFDGTQCNIEKDFKLHVDPVYGNCFTFNWDKDNAFVSKKAGSAFGIKLLLFLNTSDYMLTSETAGVRLAVHSQTEFPFPDAFGYSAPVGFVSSFGLKKQVVKRLSKPYSDCQTNRQINSSEYIYTGYDYSPEGCHRSCFQNMLIKKCKCGDPRFPLPSGQKHCQAFNATERNCVDTVIGELGDFHRMVENLSDCICKESCESKTYAATYSTSKWPSGGNDLRETHESCDDTTKEECEILYARNAAMVEVYYEQMNYELLLETEAYGVVNLLADVGGHLGLWLGFSVITIIECIVLIIDLLLTCFKCQKRTRSPFSDKTQIITNISSHVDVDPKKSMQIIKKIDEKANEKTFNI